MSELEPWAALVAWLEGFVRYAEAKRTFLTELHEGMCMARNATLEQNERLLAVVLDGIRAPG